MDQAQKQADMAKTPATTPDPANRPLADTGHDGLARVRELEGLLATAGQVRRLAEAEIREGRNLERAEQRRDAAARMQRKVERELLKLRSELAGEHPEVNQVWTPGDPVGRKPRSRPVPDSPPAAEPVAAAEAEPEPEPAADMADNATDDVAAPGDFELAVMLGTRRSRWEASTSDFSINQDTPASRVEAPRPTAARRDSSSTPPRPSRGPHASGRRRDRRGRGGLIALVAASAIAGAGLTYLLTQSPEGLSALPEYWQQLLARLLN